MGDKCGRCDWYFTVEQQADPFLRCPQCGLKQQRAVVAKRDRLMRAKRLVENNSQHRDIIYGQETRQHLSDVVYKRHI